jgi:hypothetical protein
MQKHDRRRVSVPSLPIEQPPAVNGDLAVVACRSLVYT